MMTGLMITVILLAVLLVFLCILLILQKVRKQRENFEKIILNGGRSVNDKVVRVNMGNGILNNPTDNCNRTILERRQ